MTDSPPLPRFGVRVARIVEDVRVPHDSVLLDHALSYMLAGISSVAELRTHLVFKGGTALRKCYFPGYRYSLDLDFSTRDQYHWSPDDLLELLKQACRSAEELTARFGSYSFTPQREEHRDEHPHAQLEFRIAVIFPTGAERPVKIEIAQEEPILRTISERQILHAFEGEVLQATIPVYSLDEIVVEKFRAFLQVRRILQTRSWTNRARDLYDVAEMHGHHYDDVRWAELLEPLRAKAAARGVSFSRPEDFMAPEVLSAYKAIWNDRLDNLVPGVLPDFGAAVEELRQALAEVFGTTIGEDASTSGASDRGSEGPGQH